MFLAVVTSLEPQDGPWAPSLHNAGFVNEAFAELGRERARLPLVCRPVSLAPCRDLGLPCSPVHPGSVLGRSCQSPFPWWVLQACLSPRE